MPAGVANAQYASVLEAVQKMPELSTIAKRVGDAGGLTKTLSDPKWVGTVFIPTNAVSTHCAGTASMAQTRHTAKPFQPTSTRQRRRKTPASTACNCR